MKLSDYFLWPDIAWLLLFLPLLWFVLHLLDRRREQRLKETIGPRIQALAGKWNPVERKRRRNLFLAAAFFGLVALLQPFWAQPILSCGG